MIFNPHSNLIGQHAFLSASKYHWINYDDDKILRMYDMRMTAALGTRLHEYAAEAIRLGIRQAGNGSTLSLYINDALGYKMIPEQPLYVNDYCFGTPDTIVFRRNKLRIHDLKNGVTRTSMKQLMAYAAFFCLEYHHKPHAIEMELRIYQNDEVQVYHPDPHDIAIIMDRITTATRLLEERFQLEVQ